MPEVAPIRASEQSQDTVNGPQNGGASDLTVPVESQVRASERSQETVSRSENGGADIINNALAVISGVQGTVLALQATVNKILQDKQSPPFSSTNMLAKVYQNQGGGTSLQTVPVQHQRDWTSSQTIPMQQHGVAADLLPHLDIVSDSLRRQITEGKYVNLASLLIPEFDNPNFTTNEFSGLELLRKSRRDHRLDRPLNITQFYKAFGIYKRVMCEAFPQRRLELELYEADIGNIFDRFGSLLYQYHVQFTRKAAAYLEKGIKIDWSKRNTELFQLIVGGAKAKLCDHCSQSDHQSQFCPSQINVPGMSDKRSEQIKGSGKYDATADKHGRPKVTYQGKEICNNFNTKFCNFKGCPFLHVCKKCKSFSHGEFRCEAQKSPTPAAPPPTTDGQKIKSKPSD